MGPLLAVIAIGLAIIGILGVFFGGLNFVFQTVFTYFPYFVALAILGFLIIKFGGRKNRMGEGEAGALGAMAGAATAEIADRMEGGEPSPSPTPPPSTSDSTSSDDSSNSSDGGDTTVNVGGDNISQNQLQQALQAVIAGNLGQGDDGDYVFYGPQQQQQQMMGRISPGIYNTFLQQIQMIQMNQQALMQQMIQFMQQNNYQQINNQFLLQFMEQILDVDLDEGDVSVKINQTINQIDITNIEQNIEQIIQEVSITDITYVEQFMDILITVNEGKYEIQGDVIIISANQEVRINLQTFMTFLNILSVIKYWELKDLIVALNDMSGLSWEARIEQLIIVYRDSQGGDGKEGNEGSIIINTGDITGEISGILDKLNQRENIEEDSIEKKREAIKKLRDAFKRLNNNPKLVKAIYAAAEANAGQESGSQALGAAVQRELNGSNIDITDVGEKANEIEGVWREIAEAEKLLKESFNEDLTIYKSIENKEYDIDRIAEMHREFKIGINQIKSIDWSNYNNS